MLKLKMTTGNTVQVLNTLKKRLNTLMDESEWLMKETKGRQETLGRIKEDNQRVEVEKARAMRTNAKLKGQSEDDSGMPQVMDYVSARAEMYELDNAIANWERKVEIAQIAAHK